MSQKRDREEDEMENRKVPKLFKKELCLMQYLKDLEYFRDNTLPSWEEMQAWYDDMVQWEELRKRYESLKQWEMNRKKND